MREPDAEIAESVRSIRSLLLWLGSATLLGLAIAAGVWLLYAHVETAARLFIALLTVAVAAGAWLVRSLYRADRHAKQVERSLLRERETLRSVLDNLADGVAVADASGTLTMFNPAAERLLGVGKTDTGPDSWTLTYGLYHPDTVTPFAGEDLPLAHAVRGEVPDEVEIYVRNPRRDEGLFIRVKATPVRDRTGRLSGGVAIFRDVTEAKRQLSLLRESETRFNQLVRSVPQVFWIADRSMRRIEYVSPPYQSMFGRPIDALLSNPMDWVRVVHAEDRRAAIETLRRARHERVEFDFRIARPDGEQRVIRASGFPVHDETDALARVIGIAEDVTDRRAAEDDRRVRTYAGHLQDAREEERIAVAREIHDELGQALTGLKLELSVLARRADDGAEVRERAVQLAGRVDAITASVRRISESLRPDVLDKLGLHAAFRWLAEEFERRTNVACRVTMPEGSVRIDQRRATALFRILQESLTNVARHANAAAVEVTLDASGGALELEIVDDGRGIDPSSLTTSGSFGLIGMRERARGCGGTVSVGEGPRGGTRVFVRLPEAEAASA